MGVDNRLRISITVTHDGELVVVALGGELDLAGAEDFATEMERLGAEANVVIDLRNLDFIDSMGLRSILSVHERHQETGTPFALVPGSRQVGRLLEMTRISDHVKMISSPEELEV